MLIRLGAGSKSQGSSSKIPNPRKKFNQEFKNRCGAGRVARGQGLSSPSSSDGSTSESSARGDLGVKDAANLWKDAARVQWIIQGLWVQSYHAQLICIQPTSHM